LTQTFAEPMPISRYRESVYLGGFSSGGEPFSQP
jgi:hypothetical protein